VTPGPLARLTRLVWLLYSVAGGAALVALLLTVVLDVVLRFASGSGIEGANDMVSSWWMVTIAFTGIALAQRANGRIQVDFLVDALPARTRLVVDVVVLLVVAGFALALAWGGWVEALEQKEAGEYAAIGHRLIWPFRFVVPLGFAGFAFACFLSIVELVRRGPTDAPTDELDLDSAVGLVPADDKGRTS